MIIRYCAYKHFVTRNLLRAEHFEGGVESRIAPLEYGRFCGPGLYHVDMHEMIENAGH